MIDVQNLSLELSDKTILKNISFSMKRHEFIGLIGPNGSGKSSLMRSVMRFEPKAKGQCNLWSMSHKERAKYAAWLAQERQVSWDLMVEDVIALGRLPWGAVNGSETDKAMIDQAVTALNLQDFLNRSFFSLSGGERARVLIARALAQNTEFLLADEPIDALDPAQQFHTMSLFQSLAREGRGVLISLHDLNLVARFCTRVVILSEGKIFADGAPSDVMSDENLRDVFHIDVIRAEANGPVIQSIGVVDM